MWGVSLTVLASCTWFADSGWYQPTSTEFARQFPLLQCQMMNQCYREAAEMEDCTEGDSAAVEYYGQCPEDYDAQAAGECLAELSADVTWGDCADERCGWSVPWRPEAMRTGGCMAASTTEG